MSVHLEARRLACPTCHAAVGKACKRPSGHALFGGQSHTSRLRAAGLKDESQPVSKGRIPDNLLVFPMEVADEAPPLEPGPVTPLRVPHDPPGMMAAGGLDAFAPLPEPVYTTRLGRMLCGDSLALMGLLPSESVDVCLTSPPYALTRTKAMSSPHGYSNESQDSFTAWLMRFVHQVRRLLKPSGFFVLNLGPAWEKGSPTMSTYDIETMLAIADRMYPIYTGTWYKPGTLPGPAAWVCIAKIRVTQATERIWIFSKDPYAFEKLPPDVVFDTLVRFAHKDSNGSYHRRCRQHGIPQHPARFPEALPRYFLERLAKPGAHILDPFAGSCTTGFVAEGLGMQWTGIELNRDYARNSWLRFSETPLAAGPQRALPPA